MKNFTPASQWITADDGILVNWTFPVQPSPLFRKEFELAALPQKAECIICGLGYYELYLNGSKVGDHVLDPAPTQFDKRALFVRYDLTGLLQKGKNTIGVMLGNGWYNAFAQDSWHFDKAPWRDYPKLRFEMEADGEIILVSDKTWKYSPGPIIYDELRCGETYDARKEEPHWKECGFDDFHWKTVRLTHGPGGILAEQTMPPCRIIKEFKPVSVREVKNGVFVADFGINFTGWVRVRAEGEAGEKMTLVYGEVIDENGLVDISHIRKHVSGDRFQQDEYIFAGKGVETYEPHFTYHGFQYVQISGIRNPFELEGCFVCTAFEEAGNITSSHAKLNKLHENCRRSYLSNFTGIPTDCPHREKNGWTADAQLASELGLCNFDAAEAYVQWLDSFGDVQRADGQFPGIIPSAGWGFNWGNGPVWDGALFIIAENVYDYTGDTRCIERGFPAMKKYLEYCISREDGHILHFGLGDWAAFDKENVVSTSLVVTAYHYGNLMAMVRFAGLLGKREEELYFSEHAQKVRAAFNREFRQAPGDYGDRLTAYGAALYFNLVPEDERKLTAERLDRLVQERNYLPEYGIVGNKTVPRALADAGYAETAFRIITRPDYPGFFECIDRGAVSMWGIYKGDTSRNHIMYGDVDAWLFKYPGGLHCNAGKLALKPVPLAGLDSFSMNWHGTELHWARISGGIKYCIKVPQETELTLPDGENLTLSAGETVLIR